MAPPGAKSYPTAAFILTLIGGILILLLSIYLAIVELFISSVAFAFFPGLGVLIAALAAFSVICGLIILVGAIRMRTAPHSARTWGILVIVFSVLSLASGGGYFIGFILALIGGILAVVWHPPAMAQPAWGAATPPMMAPPPGASAAPGQKVCGSCGAANAAGATFCAKCGAALPA